MIEYEEYYGKPVFDDAIKKLFPHNIQRTFNFTLSDELQKICDKMTKEKYFEKEANRFYDMYVNGIWEIEEEKDMNKVLSLWYERKRNKIIDRYNKMECEFYNNKYSVVASFKELIEKFNNDLEDLYKLDKATEQFVLKENTPNNVIKYCLDEEKLNEEFKKEYLSKRDEEFNTLRDIKDEVEAQLSLSDDLEYQQEVLIRYDIIYKKTKKIAD